MKTLWNNTWIWSTFSRIQHSPCGYLCLVTLLLTFPLASLVLCFVVKKLQHIRFSLLFTLCNRLKCALGCALGYSSSRTKEIKSLVGTARKPPYLKPRLAELGFTYWNKVTEQEKTFVQIEQRLNPGDSNTTRLCCSEESHCASVKVVGDLHLKSCTWKLMELQKKQSICAQRLFFSIFNFTEVQFSRHKRWLLYEVQHPLSFKSCSLVLCLLQEDLRQMSHYFSLTLQ